MAILDAIVGGAKKATSAVSDKVSEMGDAVSSVSSTAGNSFFEGMRKMADEAQTSLSGGVSHEQRMAEMENHERSMAGQYASGLGL